VGPYQDDITALFNYPMYYTINDVFGNGKAFTNINNRYAVEDLSFKDVDALGLFVDNHDNPRFLCNHPNMEAQLRNAVVFSLTGRGIPFVYYGTEQYYNGCADPANRESLWNDMDQNSDLYLIIQRVNEARKTSQIWNYDFIDRYHTQNFYCFTRGDFMTCLTNSTNQQHYMVTYTPWQDGEVVCNIFYPTTDCQTVSGGVDVWLLYGESKIYVPKSTLTSFTDIDDQGEAKQAEIRAQMEAEARLIFQ
jgi:alpha-amylase